MKAKKLLALSMTAAMVLGMTACGGEETGNSNVSEESSAESSAAESSAESSAEASESKEEEKAVVDLQVGEVSIDFEDGNSGFIGNDATVNSAQAGKSAMELVSYNGSNALKITPQDGLIFAGFSVPDLLGENASKVKTIEMTLGIENPDGKFGAASGKVYSFLGEDNAKNEMEWSVYLETANPKRVTVTVPDGQSFVEGNYMVLSLETDTGKDKGATAANLYIDDIAFKDADGNVLTADTTVAYKAASAGVDRSNLFAVKDAVNFEGFSISGGAWGQDGLEMPQEILDALVPGSVVEVSYTSESGDMWILFPDSEAGWMRVGQGNADGSGADIAYMNNSGNIAQITYEQIAALCGDDVSTWGARMQCEASGAWQVNSVKVGMAAPAYTVQDAVTFEGFACSGSGWGQDGFEMPQEILDALVPGSVVEVSYSSENGDMWILMPDSEAGWMRVGQGNADGSGSDSAIFDGSKCYVTYEQIAAVCGDDVSKWGARMQCEASGAWEVYGIKVGKAAEFKALKNLVNFEGFSCSADAWNQDGFEMPQEIIDALVPGSVVTVNYTSESGDMWILFPDSEAGWMRVGQGNADGSGSDSAVFDGSNCQVTYEQIAAVCGDDVSTWGARIQCEASGAWQVNSVKVGMAADVAADAE